MSFQVVFTNHLSHVWERESLSVSFPTHPGREAYLGTRKGNAHFMGT